MAGLVSTGVLSAEAVRVELPSPVLRVEEAHGEIIAGMGVHGVAFVDSVSNRVAVRKDWPTVSAEKRPENRVMLCGRDGRMRIVEITKEGPAGTTTIEWDVEGLPSDSSTHGNLTALACGGAGVSLWEWREADQPPHLIGRYPFTGYAKQVDFHTNGILLVADSHELGLVALDVSDPYRPRRLGFMRMRGYCDSVESDGTTILAVNRYGGVVKVEPEPGFSGFRQHEWITPLVDEAAEYRPGTARLAGSLLLLPEMASGLRVFQITDDGFQRAGIHNQPKIALDAVMLPDGRVAVADFTGAIVLLELGEHKLRAKPTFSRDE